MVAEIVCVGTELLLGDIVNTNAQHISKELAHIGIDLYYQTVVGDNKERVWNVLDTESYGINEMTESQKKQALVPEGSLVVTNPAGLAPGIIMAQGDKAIVMLPGPPKEMKAVLAECCHLFINRLSDQVFVSINIKCKGPDELPLREIGEAPVADLLGDILDNENPTVATYAKEDGVLIRVTASGKTREDALTAMQPVVTKIAEILAGKIAWVKEEV